MLQLRSGGNHFESTKWHARSINPLGNKNHRCSPTAFHARSFPDSKTESCYIPVVVCSCCSFGCLPNVYIFLSLSFSFSKRWQIPYLCLSRAYLGYEYIFIFSGQAHNRGSSKSELYSPRRQHEPPLHPILQITVV